jgi:signal peptidase II
MKKRLKIFLFCMSCLAFISWDRTTKDLAKEHLMNKEPVSYLHDTFRLEYVENTGAAMSLGDNLPDTVSFWLLSIVPLMVLLVLFFYVIKNARVFSFPKMLVYALIIAGGLGNVIDRLFFDRHVSDFMNIGFRNIRSGIFNFADVCITMGAIGLLLTYHKKELPLPVK